MVHNENHRVNKAGEPDPAAEYSDIRVPAGTIDLRTLGSRLGGMTSKAASIHDSKVARLAVLVSALLYDKLSVADMAAMLACPPSAIRNYLFELTNAGVVIAVASEHCRYRSYTLSDNLALVDQYITRLRRVFFDRVQKGPTRYKDETSDDCQGNDFSSLDRAGCGERWECGKVRRDPLVAALFGEPGK